MTFPYRPFRSSRTRSVKYTAALIVGFFLLVVAALAVEAAAIMGVAYALHRWVSPVVPALSYLQSTIVAVALGVLGSFFKAVR